MMMSKVLALNIYVLHDSLILIGLCTQRRVYSGHVWLGCHTPVICLSVMVGLQALLGLSEAYKTKIL